jgi:hypothetical protein
VLAEADVTGIVHDDASIRTVGMCSS